MRHADEARKIVLRDGSPPLHRVSRRGRYRAYHSKYWWITVAGAAPEFRTSRLTFSASTGQKAPLIVVAKLVERHWNVN
ncbi:hypothetical protein Misp06_00938 [Microbulbifer sp. NBRC 101763]